jgi:cobalt-zinc-cadmium efflux system outer membrane protein
MTLDAAIVMVAEQNLALRAKFQEIPKATADVLTAGLRGNPLVFGSVDDAPYGQYSPTKPGDVGYGVTIIQPVDINRKRAYRVIAAQRARDVLQAQYQDAVRLEIETLYVRYVDVLAARENLRYVDASLAGLADVRGAIEQLVRGQEVSTLDLDRILVQIDSADVARLDAIAGLEKAKQNLAALLMLPSPEVAPLEIRGSIQSDATALADVDQLLELAQMNRPDLRAYQLGVGRASAEVDLAVKERYPDVFVLYTPWGIKDNTASGGQNTSSWGVSGMASIPIFNRNQGNIRRAELNVGQTRMEWAHLSRQIESEVRQAYRDYQLAAEKVKRLDASILPRAKTIRDKTLTQLRGGQVDTLAYLQSQRDYVEVVRQYRDALVDLRRAALHVNTVVGVRLAY